MREIKSDEARRSFRDILDEMERDPAAAVKVLRYDRPVAVVVSAEWHRVVTNYIEDGLRGQTPAEFWDFMAASLRESRRATHYPPSEALPGPAFWQPYDAGRPGSQPSSESEQEER